MQCVPTKKILVACIEIICLAVFLSHQTMKSLNPGPWLSRLCIKCPTQGLSPVHGHRMLPSPAHSGLTWRQGLYKGNSWIEKRLKKEHGEVGLAGRNFLDL